MAQYVARFIPDFASRTEPLRRLTRKDAPWEWTQQEQDAFDNIKEALTSTQVMAYFNPAKQTDVLVDASPVGVDAILAQEGKIIAYASRALTDVEQRYSQTDREMLPLSSVSNIFIYTCMDGISRSTLTTNPCLVSTRVKNQRPLALRDGVSGSLHVT